MALTKVTSGGISDIAAAVEGASDSNKFTDADHTKLNAIEASATADQTNAEIRTAVEAASDSNVFTDADHTKLNAIEASATADQTKSDIEGLGIDVPAANLTGTIPDARFPATLPAISGANLTGIDATADNYLASSGLSNKDLGIGLHIKTGDAGLSSVNDNFSQVLVEGNLHSGMAIISGSTHEGILAFSDSGGHRGLVRYKHATDSLSFATTDVDRMFIDSNGAVSKPYQPSFWASGTAVGGYNNYTTEMVFTNAQHNIGSHYSTSTGRFTAPVAGAYFFTGTVYGTKGSSMRWTIKKNQVQYGAGGAANDCVPHGYNNDTETTTCTVVLNLAANDYVSMMPRSGHTINMYGGHSWFSGVLVG